MGDNIPVMTFLYGPATKTMVNILSTNPATLLHANGLWEATISLCDYVVCASPRGETPVLQCGLMGTIRARTRARPIAMPANTRLFPLPDWIGENDVDSTIHLLFTRVPHLNCRELMCNPPGGDWSGISLFHNEFEYRWLTLPRVSASGFKRPDHVIQIGDDLILSIESKDCLRNLEKKIGPRLNGYCRDLFKSPPSCKRRIGADEWSDDTSDFALPNLRFASAGAFLGKSPDDAISSLKTAKTDCSFAMAFAEDNTPLMRIAFAKSAPPEVRGLFRGVESGCGLKMKIQLL